MLISPPSITSKLSIIFHDSLSSSDRLSPYVRYYSCLHRHFMIIKSVFKQFLHWSNLYFILTIAWYSIFLIWQFPVRGNVFGFLQLLLCSSLSLPYNTFLFILQVKHATVTYFYRISIENLRQFRSFREFPFHQIEKFKCTNVNREKNESLVKYIKCQGVYIDI